MLYYIKNLNTHIPIIKNIFYIAINADLDVKNDFHFHIYIIISKISYLALSLNIINDKYCK